MRPRVIVSEVLFELPIIRIYDPLTDDKSYNPRVEILIDLYITPNLS